MPAIKSMFTLGNSGRLNPRPGAVNLRRLVSPAVLAQNFIVEVFDAEAQPRDAQLAEGVHLRFAERAGFALEGHFLRFVPADVGFEPRSTSRRSCFSLRNEGVPPPKYTKRNGRPPIAGSRLTSSISRDKAAR